MVKPRVGIATDLGMRDATGAPLEMAFCYTAYFDAVIAAGAVPLLMVPDVRLVDEYLKAVDGIVLTGGTDYDPALWGEQTLSSTEPIAGRRQDFDVALARRLKQTDHPVLGICAGMQLINIIYGGGVWQDLKLSPEPTAPHKGPDPFSPRHPIKVSPGTRLHLLYGDHAEVNSAHHQAINGLGFGLCATARSQDGVVEALELSGRRFVMGVQWHPERETDDPIIPEFVRQCDGKGQPA